MSHSAIKLLDGAILLSDAHYSFKHKALREFLKALRTQKIQTPQLILMGDVFDLLFGGIAKTITRNQDVVDLINTLSDNIEIIYLEGNHDFNLKEIFPGVQVFKLSEQPLECTFGKKKVGLAHGDFNAPLGYRFYTALIRNPFVLRILNLLNTLGKGFILNGLDRKLSAKDDCKEIPAFERYTKRHLLPLDLNAYDLFIEGHHHQDVSFKIENTLYVNMPAFACGLKYMRLDDEGLSTEMFEHLS